MLALILLALGMLPEPISLSYFAQYHGLQTSNVYQQLNRSVDFRIAIGAQKVRGMWNVDSTLVRCFDPLEWDVNGKRRICIDPERFVKVSALDPSIGKNQRVRYLLTKSKTIRNALGATTFNGFRTIYIRIDLLDAFQSDEWFYCPDIRDWARIEDRTLVPFCSAFRIASDPGKTWNLFRRCPAVREALRATRLKGDKRWWVDREALSNFNARLWNYRGVKKDPDQWERHQSPAPRTFSKELAQAKKPGLLTAREAAWLVRWDKNRLRKFVIQPGNAKLVGATQTKNGHWLFDETLFKSYFELPPNETARSGEQILMTTS